MFSDVAVSANADDGAALATTDHKNANNPAKVTTSVVIKKNARATYKSVRNTVRANNFEIQTLISQFQVQFGPKEASCWATLVGNDGGADAIVSIWDAYEYIPVRTISRLE